MSTKVERNSNLELFRIFAMLAIVAHHFVVNSGLTSEGGEIFSQIENWRSTFLLIFGAWGKTGINCFILITGYFMCESAISVRKYVKLLAQIFFYRIVIYIILYFAGYETISASRLIKLVLPISEVDKGFTSCFLVFFLCIPLLNILVHNLTEKLHIYLLILSGVVYIIMPTLSLNVAYNYVIWYSILFFIASYIRLYPKKIFANTKFWGIASIVSFIVAAASVYVCSAVFARFGISPRPFFFVNDSNKILAVVLAISLFMYFSNVKINTVG